MVLQSEMRPKPAAAGCKVLTRLAATSGSVPTAAAGQGRWRDSKRKRLAAEGTGDPRLPPPEGAPKIPPPPPTPPPPQLWQGH